MRRYCLFLFAALLIIACKTNPPTDPNAVSVNDGEIVVRIKFIQNPSLLISKKVLLEDFANVSCVPCVSSNQIIKTLINSSYGSQKLVSIKFPTNFPSPNDPFYTANKTACNYRMSYYNIMQAPTIIIDGVVKPIPTDSNSYKQAIDSRLNTLSSFDFNITKETQSGGIIFDLSISVKDTASLNLDNLYLRFAVVESEIEFTSPPGSNGEVKFYDVMRILLPSNDGFVLSDIKNFTGNGNVFHFYDAINSLWNNDKLKAVVFIQNKLTKEVLQTASTFSN